MGDDAGRTAGIAAEGAPAWDRFAHWPAFRARLALLALVLVLIASAMVPITAGRSTVETKSFVENLVGEEKGPERKRDDDLALYDRAIERIQKGENYYDFIVEEHRQANYPVRPGLAVRLPTLAYIDAWLGEPGQIVMAMVLMIAVLLAWWRRLGDEPGGPRHRLIAMSLLIVGVSLWWLVLTITLSRARRRMAETTIARLNRGVAVLLGVMGVGMLAGLPRL